jgi:hypothetical protein
VAARNQLKRSMKSDNILMLEKGDWHLFHFDLYSNSCKNNRTTKQSYYGRIS